MTDATFWETFDQAGFALARMLLSVLWQSSILFVAAYPRFGGVKGASTDFGQKRGTAACYGWLGRRWI